MRNHPSNYGIKILDNDLLRGPDGHIPTVETNQLNEYKISQLKAIFDSEIVNVMKSLLMKLSDEEILTHFYMKRDYSINTNWYDQCIGIESFKNYFEAIAYFDFCSLKNLNEEELQISVPHRTCQPVSDGENYFRVINGNYVKNTLLEEAVFLLSSGKISFCEIVDILSRSERFKHIENIDSVILNIYKQFDKERLIVWKRSL